MFRGLEEEVVMFQHRPIPRGFFVRTKNVIFQSQGVAELHQDGIRVVGGQAGQTFRFF